MATRSVTQQDVLLAILAMDAYSRHNDSIKRKLNYEKDAELSRSIGTAKWNFSSDEVIPASDSSGFSASSYNIGGTKVISYRGTDLPTNLGNSGQVFGFLRDVVTGWFTSFDIYGAESGGTKRQHAFAQDFYELVAGRQLLPGPGETAPPAATGILLNYGDMIHIAGFPPLRYPPPHVPSLPHHRP
jgi:hypothetical protein